MDRAEILNEATLTLSRLFNDYKKDGLLSIYLWGSIVTPDFNPSSSDIDSVGILSDEADFNELDKMREWLPKLNPKLVRLQINFFYLSELTLEKPVRSRLARLYSPEQAIFDFPHWEYVCGTKINPKDLPSVSVERFLQDQIEVVKIREQWAKHPKEVEYPQYYCKSLVWLCYAIHKLNNPKNVFSWEQLQAEANEDSKELVSQLVYLKRNSWEPKLIKRSLPLLFEKVHLLEEQYKR